MTPVSRRYLKPEIQEDLIKEFWFALGKLNSSEIELFLSNILSPTETIVLAKRIEILKKLRIKTKYSDIGDIIKVTDATVAKMSEKMQKAGTSFIKIIDRLITDEKRRWEMYVERRKPNYAHGKFIGGIIK